VPITAQEKFESREGETGRNASTDLIYIASGSSDDDAIVAFVLANAPASRVVNGVTLYKISAQIRAPLTVDAVANTGAWEVVVRYSPNSDYLIVGQERISGTTAGGSKKISTGIKRIDAVCNKTYYKLPPNFDASCGPNGAEVGVGVFEFSVTKAFADGDVTLPFFRTLKELTYTTNIAPWRAFDALECLFRGVSSFVQRGDGTWEFTFDFAGGANDPAVQIDGMERPMKVDAWNWLWTHDIDVSDEAAPGLITRPAAAYSIQTYRATDFSRLNIRSTF
jgi:hypothetical protein